MRVSAGWATRLALPVFFTGISIFYRYIYYLLGYIFCTRMATD